MIDPFGDDCKEVLLAKTSDESGALDSDRRSIQGLKSDAVLF